MVGHQILALGVEVRTLSPQPFIIMSDKEKKSKRLHNKRVKIEKQIKIAKSAGLEVKDPNRFSKHHATNCHTKNCPMCGNPRRVFKEKTMQEKKFESDKDE